MSVDVYVAWFVSWELGIDPFVGPSDTAVQTRRLALPIQQHVVARCLAGNRRMP